MKRLICVVLVTLFLASGLAFAEQKGNICVATQEKSSEAAVSDKAGLAPYFIIFDEKGNLVESIDNPFKGKNEAGKLMLGFLVEKGVDHKSKAIFTMVDRAITDTECKNQ